MRSFSLVFPFLLAAATFVGGCATYRARPLSVRDQKLAFEARTLAEPALQRFVEDHGLVSAGASWPPPVWDVQLLTLAAYFYRADLEIARARLALAEAGVITAGTRSNPTVGFNPTYDLNPVDGVSPWTLGFTLDLPLETAGKRNYRVVLARQTVNSARLNYASAIWRVRNSVREGMTALEGAMADAAILGRQLELQSGTVNLLEERQRAGEASSGEVRLLRIAVAQTALDRDDAIQRAEEMHIRLAEAIGVPAKALDGKTFSFASLDLLPSAEDAGTARHEALLSRTDVLGALSEYDASQVSLQLEIAKQYPDLRLGPGYAWDQGENKFTLGLAVALPLFDRNRGLIAEAEARRREAAANFSAVQAHAIADIELAYAGYRGALKKLGTADNLVHRRNEQIGAAEESLAAGMTDRVEFLQAQVEAGLSERARSTAFNEAQRALRALEYAMQHPAGLEAGSGVPASLLNDQSNTPKS